MISTEQNEKLKVVVPDVTGQSEEVETLGDIIGSIVHGLKTMKIMLLDEYLSPCLLYFIKNDNGHRSKEFEDTIKHNRDVCHEFHRDLTEAVTDLLKEVKNYFPDGEKFDIAFNKIVSIFNGTAEETNIPIDEEINGVIKDLTDNEDVATLFYIYCDLEELKHRFVMYDEIFNFDIFDGTGIKEE